MTKKQSTDTPVQKNDIITATFEDLTHEGAGVAKVDGYALFVPYGLPGETAKIKVLKTKKGYGFGKMLERIEESSDRTDAPCPIYYLCGGCQLQHMTYDAQLRFKHKQVQDAMKRIGGLEDVPVHPSIGMEDPWRYRNKAQVPVGENEDGDLKAGFFQKRSHRIIDMESCIIQQGANDEAVQIVKEIADKYNIKAYEEDKHRGTLRHIVTRQANSTEQLMIILVTNGPDLPHKKNLIADIREAMPNVTSIMHNANNKRTNVIFGEKTDVIWGEEYIYDYIGDIKFAISARSFYQVNPSQTKVLYDKALEYADLQGNETVIDAYCGIGTISLFLAQKAKHVYGVEVIPEAVSDAKRNAELNKMEGVTTFAVGEAEDVVPWWHKANGLEPDVFVVDPPRKGCDETLLQTMIDMKPEKIVYVSCNPATLARDLKILEDGGYETKEVQPVDMFPQTNHVETVVKLVRK
ncbi:23S rRNA (uracil(1939)-C(5))-methyltransferase RlmD [Salibacterium salarium]|uniref:23S rRNA (Uracil(1939)-C(5))-methyltransferase RlmD n=1 Tax=Salibacterium salarium TaxID=284579 RepID=A0A3R9RBN9_9BACI|nr:23S rRNA (uracil(1939)-C(5))-methyltransferase RlmD [Salibacterium salarium]RSL31764.1 23S rRNA (uracil(1939)-C(5))-methyltransferase RlmD [Salibacterium salarium]